jgi:hypothetical protein
MTTINYSGRLVDLLIHQGVKAVGETQVQLSFGDGLVCTGAQRAAQTFTQMFLTDVGSRLRDPNYGTHFMRALRNREITDENGVHAAFQAAVADIQEYLSNVELPEDSDEQFVDATLTEWDLRPTGLSIYVTIETAAGTEREIYLPVKVAIR